MERRLILNASNIQTCKMTQAWYSLNLDNWICGDDDNKSKMYDWRSVSLTGQKYVWLQIRNRNCVFTTRKRICVPINYMSSNADFKIVEFFWKHALKIYSYLDTLITINIQHCQRPSKSQSNATMKPISERECRISPCIWTSNKTTNRIDFLSFIISNWQKWLCLFFSNKIGMQFLVIVSISISQCMKILDKYVSLFLKSQFFFLL